LKVQRGAVYSEFGRNYKGRPALGSPTAGSAIRHSVN
jgi:hypothetical protein